MAENCDGSECVIIEDNDINDQPGPVRSLHNPSACDYEAKWFEQPFNRPTEQVVCSEIPEKYISQFKQLIWNQPNDRMVPGYGMTPKELACISSDGRKGWLVTSHFYWLSRCINQQQTHTCFFVLDPAIKKISLQKLMGNKSVEEVKRLIFVMSVGRQDDGIVFLGTDQTPGDHWSIAVVEISTGLLSYCDTLGWPEPEKLLPCIIKYTQILGIAQSSHLKLRRAHHPNLEQHECTALCTNYPLQTCSDVCGVIAMICIAVAALDKDLFELMMAPKKENFNLYLTDPTDFSPYLRHVLVYWVASNNIDISRISLKHNFDPCKTISKEKNVLKRKLESLSNGNSESGPKKINFQSNFSQDGNFLNDFILTELKNKTSYLVLSEVVSKIGTYTQAKDAHAKKIRRQYSGFTINANIIRARVDKASTRIYFAELFQHSSNPIILFKNRGMEMQNFEKDDIAVAIQSPFQKQMMEKYGTECICVELPSTRNNSKLYLMTVLVFVNGMEEIPVAWLISNKMDSNCIDLFFKMLRTNVGHLQTSFFIGDSNGITCKIWTQHFPKPVSKMFCNWDVQHIFNNIIISSISDDKTRSEIRDYLYAMSFISNSLAFESYAEALFMVIMRYKKFSDNLRSKFFIDSKPKSWATCYRFFPSYKSIPFLESFTGTLKVLDFFNRNVTDRIDTFVHSLLQLNRFMENKLVIMPCQISLNSAIQEINFQHLRAMDEVDIYVSASGEEWYIPASDKTDSVSVMESGNDSCECQLKCSSCKICVHKYVCTCVNYLMQPGACEHIHFIHKYRKINRVLCNSLESSSKSSKTDSEVKSGSNKLKDQVRHELSLLGRKINDIHDSKKLQQLYSVLQDL